MMAAGARRICLFILLAAAAISLSLPATPGAQASTATTTTTTSGGECTFDDFRNALRQRESSNRTNVCNSAIAGDSVYDGTTTAARGRDCCGLYQICAAERERLGFTDREAYMNSREIQEQAYTAYLNSSMRELQNNGSWGYIGQTINGVPINAAALVGAAHIAGGPRVAAWLACGGCAAQDKCDSNGTCLSHYMRNFGRYGGPDGGNGENCTALPPNAGPLCDTNIRARVSEQVDGSVAKVSDVVKTHFPPPPSTSQVANTPCMSKELQRITNQFGSFPRQAAGSLTGGLMSAAGPISGLMQRLFQSEFNSLNQAASILPSMLNFQSQASSVLSGLLGSLGLGDAFSSEVCGLMVDMLLKYIQCENPIQMPNINNMFGSLNNLLPNNCAGNALRSGLMEAGNMRSLQTVNQPVSIGGGGQFVPGSADSANQQRGTTWTPPAGQN